MLPFLARRAVPSSADDGLATQIGDAASRDLFALLGDPPSPDRKLQSVAWRLLQEHLERVANGAFDPNAVQASGSSNVSCLGTLDEVRTELTQRGGLHAWGHFIALPRAHAEAVATFVPADGVPRVYMATIWRS